MRPRSLVELGTHTGVSYFAFCQAANTLRLDTQCYAVDTWKGEEHAGFYDDTVFQDVEQRNIKFYAHRSRLLRQTFDEARVHFSPQSIDLLHIDGFHSYEAVRHDFETWRETLSDRSVVLFHDINVRERDFGVWRFWEEISSYYPHFSFLHCNGLGVLAVGANQSPDMQWLFNLGQDQRDEVRQFFQARGGVFEQAIRDRTEKDNFQRDLAQVSGQRIRELDHLHQVIGELRSDSSKQLASLAKAQEDISHSERGRSDAEFRVGLLSQRLDAVYRSSSWRLAGPLRRILRLLYRALGRSQTVGVPFLPLQQLQALSDGRWEATGTDPQFQLASPPLLGLSGTIRFSLTISDATEPLDPVLYLDCGGTHDEIRLPSLINGTVAVELPRAETIQAIRLDPSVRPTEFTLNAIQYTPVPANKAEKLMREVRNPGAWKGALRYWRTHGTKRTVDRFLQVLRPQAVTLGETYQEWIRRYDSLSDDDIVRIMADIAALPTRPVLSIVMPVYNPRPADLIACIASIQDQLYPHWELCIADDCSTDPAVHAVLRKAASGEPRIKLVMRETNGHICAASNSALDLVTSEWVALVDHDDVLPRHALYMVAQSIARDPAVDVLYSDEDKIGPDGQRFDPHFKSDWNPELILTQNMVNHLGVYRTAVLKAVGGFREGYEGSQDHDLVLRVARQVSAQRIRHLPYILYHWRIHPNAGTFSTVQRERSYAAARRAIQDHLVALGSAARVDEQAGLEFPRIRWPLPEELPCVSVIIPTRDRLELVRGCVEGLLTGTDYPALDIIIMDNDSIEPDTLAWFAEVKADPRVRVIKFPGEFNFSAINNAGVAEAKGDLLLLLNNDIKVIGPDWLKEMVSYALQPAIGAVGAKLLYADGRVQHAGVVVGLGGVAGHAFLRIAQHEGGWFKRAVLPQDLSCVTAACLLTRREVFDAVGGLDAEGLKVAFNDVDFCLKIRKAGYRIVQAQHAVLYHLESASRGSDLSGKKLARFQREIEVMRTRWQAELANDPFYNPNLTLIAPGYDLAFPPRVVKPWLR